MTLSLLASFGLIGMLACDGASDSEPGIDTAVEDTAPPPPDNDTDDDGILDLHEGTEDQDGDGVPNFEDLDSD